ncbi:hypothetical protein POTOM_056891 [Populus tomentosa]|uniref:Pentatricopeptide repeat-containing protein n=1 Tax=Populus tomentosa TaxID=118781 RepID=A0A8X7XRR9_POPTO|nr:hypothetical protein POTOM_056891 [Populus tomentosa]
MMHLLSLHCLRLKQLCEVFRLLSISNWKLETIKVTGSCDHEDILACNRIGDLNLGKSVHGLRFRFGDEVNVQNTLVRTCCCREEGGVEFPRKVLDEMCKLDSVSWSAMIGGYVQFECVYGFSCARVREVRGVLRFAMRGRGVEAVEMLSREGFVKEALKFVQEMPIDPNPVIWHSLINACRAHGELKLGEKINRQLIRNETMHESNYLPGGNAAGKSSLPIMTPSYCPFGAAIVADQLDSETF